MKNSFFLIVAGSALLVSGNVFAASLTNYDETPHTLIITENGNQSKITLEGNQSVEGVCVNGCTLKYGESEEYNLAGDEIVAIEDNQIYVDQMDNGSNDPDEEQPTETEDEGEPAPEEQPEE